MNENNQLQATKFTGMEEIMTMAKVFAESGMFADTKLAAQAFVKIQAGSEIGIPPFQAMSGIHIIQGKVAIGAGVIASRVKGSGKYDYKVIQQDEKVCSIDFYQGKDKIGNSTFTIEDAKKAQTKNLDKFPKNMLFARAISNGVKWFTPDVFSGPVYVPEEMNVIEDVPHVLVSTNISQADPTMPTLSDTNRAYMKVCNDVTTVCELIENATDTKQLKLFNSINMVFFKANPDIKEMLNKKGVTLKAQSAEPIPQLQPE